MLVFNKSGNGYAAVTPKGSSIIIYQIKNSLMYEWFIKGPNDNYKSPEKNTQQQQELADEVSMNGYWTAEETIESAMNTINTVYNKEIKWRIE